MGDGGEGGDCHAQVVLLHHSHQHLLRKDDICSATGPEGGERMIFPPRISWWKAGDLCRRFGGRLHIDDSAAAAEETFAMVEAGELVRPLRCRRVWLGAEDNDEEGIWRDSESGEVLDLSQFWVPGTPNGVRIQNCAGIWELDGSGIQRYDDGGCEKELQCSMCNFPLPPRATLRGLCKNNLVDVFYTIRWDASTNLPYYHGFLHSIIKYNEDMEAWQLSSVDNSVNGTSVASITTVGTGSQTWQFDKDICLTNSLDPFATLMTVCSLQEFTCLNDGACISMEKRCDQFPNCDDFSDENQCSLVVQPANYAPDYAPFTVSEEGMLLKVKVGITIDLIKILDINEVGQIFGNQFNLYMTWYDFRLKLHNMKDNINMNTLTKTEKEGIWVPSLVFSNTEAKVTTVNDPKAFAVARCSDHLASQLQSF